MAFSTNLPGNLVTSSLALDFAATARIGNWLQTSVDIQTAGKRQANGWLLATATSESMINALSARVPCSW
jgi:hypothetical protein